MCRRFADARGRLRAAAALVLLAGGAPAAGAEPVTVTLDAPRATVRWVLPGFPDTARGTFRLEQGVVSLDTASGAADGCLRVDTRSGESGNRTRDRKMHEQILETARYPVTTLRPTRVDGAWPASGGEGRLQVQGLLTLHGAEHPVTLPVRVVRQGDRVTADATLSIPYVAWGLADPSVFVFRASKSVDLELHAAGVVTSDTLPSAGCGP